MFPSNMDQNICLPIMTVNVEIKLNVRWAVKEPKSHCTYSDAQKAYMVEKFDIGKITGRKMDLYFASDERRNTGKYTRRGSVRSKCLSIVF